MVQNDTWPRLAEHRQVVFYDQRGLGASTRIRPGAPQTLDAAVADLEALRSHLGFAKFDLVGDSFGGFIAMAYAAAHPTRVDKLILSDPAPPDLAHMRPLLDDVFPDEVESSRKQAASLPTAAEKASAELRSHFRMLFYSQELRDRYLAGAKDLGQNDAIGEAMGSAVEHVDLTPTLAKFSCPTLVLNGRFDMNTTAGGAWKIAHSIPGATVVFFEKSGHLPAFEEPDRYVSVVDAFLRGGNPGSSR